LDFKILSDNILFYSNSKNNSDILKLKPNNSRQLDYNFKVIKKPANNSLITNVFIGVESKPISKIELRKLKLKYYWGIIYGLLALAIFIIFQYKIAFDLLLKLIGQKVEKLDLALEESKQNH
jgi:hypothetical protein